MALDIVSDYIGAARTLLQDLTVPYRYSDAEIVGALNAAVMESRRIRPDLWLPISGALPSFSSGSVGASVAIDVQYRQAFVYYLVGMMQLRDAEDTQDPRAMAFLGKFASQLTSTG